MKFSCLKSNLEPILHSLSRVVSSRPTLPVLNNILIRANENQVMVAATNLDIGIEAQIGAKVESPGSFTVPAKLLTEFVSSIPHDKVDFELTETLLSVKSENYQASFNGIDAEEYPETPALKGSEKLLLMADDLIRHIPLVTFAAAADETRPVITGVLVTLDGKELTLVAADGYRLAERKVQLKEDSGRNGERLIIPSRSLVELQRLLGASSEEKAIEMAFDENQVIFSMPNVQLVSRLLVGQYPDYKQIIPASFKTTAQLSRTELQKAARIASLFAKESASVIHLKIESGKLSIKAASSQIGQNSTELAATTSGPDGEIAYNARYLLDVLAVLEDNNVILKVNDPLGPGVVLPEGEPNYTYVIMPIRT